MASGAVAGAALPLLATADEGIIDLNDNSLSPASVLEVTIIATDSVPYGTALIKNNSNALLHIDNFTPGTIAFDKYFVEMVQATGISHASPIVLAPGETRSFQIRAQELYNARMNDNTPYVWAGNSIEKLTDNTVVAHVYGSTIKNRALLYDATVAHPPV